VAQVVRRVAGDLGQLAGARQADLKTRLTTTNADTAHRASFGSFVPALRDPARLPVCGIRATRAAVQTVWIREEHQLLGGSSAQTFATVGDANAAIAGVKKSDSRVAEQIGQRGHSTSFR
jgi:hypothetical protein